MDLNSNLEPTSSSGESTNGMQGITTSTQLSLSQTNLSPFIEILRERMRSSYAPTSETNPPPEENSQREQTQPELNSDTNQPSTNNPAQSTIFEIQNLFYWLAGNGKFLLLLILYCFSSHAIGISSFLWFTGFYLYTRQIVMKQEYLKGDRDFSVLLTVFVLISFNLLIAFWLLFGNNDSIHYFLFHYKIQESMSMSISMSMPMSLGKVLWMVSVYDTLLALALLAFKSILLSFLGLIKTSLFIQLRQGYYSLEGVVHLYRFLLPIPLWLAFFLDHSNTSIILASFYIYFKLTSLWTKMKQVFSLMKGCLFRRRFGVYATVEQQLENENNCPICQDSFKNAIVLPCNHIFCEECVVIWLEKENTCPICRFVIQQAGQRLEEEYIRFF